MNGGEGRAGKSRERLTGAMKGREGIERYGRVGKGRVWQGRER